MTQLLSKRYFIVDSFMAVWLRVPCANKWIWIWFIYYVYFPCSLSLSLPLSPFSFFLSFPLYMCMNIFPFMRIEEKRSIYAKCSINIFYLSLIHSLFLLFLVITVCVYLCTSLCLWMYHRLQCQSALPPKQAECLTNHTKLAVSKQSLFTVSSDDINQKETHRISWSMVCNLWWNRNKNGLPKF